MSASSPTTFITPFSVSAPLAQLQADVAPYRHRLVQHPLYTSISTLAQLRLLMEHHVFAVWDFMSLLKYLQRELTSVTLPWQPVGRPDTRYLINEIVVSEECDLDPQGHRLSHFELYIAAMQEAGADVHAIKRVMLQLSMGKTLGEALLAGGAPEAVRQFVLDTFGYIDSGKLHVVAAVFTFGREDLIPDMFATLVEDIDRTLPDKVSLFKYYLNRHVAMEDGQHGQLALQMVSEICGYDELKWEEATAAAIQAIEARIALWDGVLAEIAALTS
jgi:hypothetical protein